MSFNDIVGNPRIKKILRKALQRGRMPNSLLFCGPPGVGKIDLAHVVAKALNCLNLENDACETCTSCTAINKGNFPDVMRIAAERDILKIEQMRELKKAAYLKPMVGRKRVFIIDSAERMNPKAANSLLKILEEPPSFSYIILVTSYPYIILPTIKSRCQVLNFSPVSQEDIQSCLLQREYTKEKAKILSLLVRGNLKQAINMEWDEIRLQREEAWELFDSLIRKEPSAAYFKEASSQNRKTFGADLRPQLELMTSFARDLVLLIEKADPMLLLNPDFESRLQDLVSSVPLEQILALLGLIEKMLLSLQKNINIKLLMSYMISESIGNQHV